MFFLKVFLYTVPSVSKYKVIGCFSIEDRYVQAALQKFVRPVLLKASFLVQVFYYDA